MGKMKISNNKRKTLKIQNAIVLQNGYAIPQMKSAYIPKNGYIKMISNNGSNYDVLMEQLAFNMMQHLTAKNLLIFQVLI